ncbi:hypothetical protein [Oryzomicrobium sp.]|uniref:LPD3 domain-containing protein n=1 Tax=Oryzomicrobium sp. TaxID=1911578 RepID=UPI002FDF5277
MSNEFDAAVIAAMQPDQGQAARVGFSVAADTNPDAYAEAQRVARRTGVPVTTVFAMPKEMKRQAAVMTIDFDSLAQTSPATAALLADVERAKIAHDDVDNMSSIENALSFLGGSAMAGLNDLAGAGAKLLDSLNPFTLSDSDAAVLYRNDPDKLARMREQSPAMALSRFARGRTQAAAQNMQDISPGAKATYGNLKYATADTGEAAYLSPVKVVGDAIRSLPTTAALALTTYLTRGAAVQAEKQALAAGLAPEAAREAAVAAATNMATKFGAASEGAIGYAQQALQTQNDIEAMPIDKLAASPEYQKLVAQGYDPNAARIFLAARAGEQAGLGAGAVDALTNAIGGRFLGKIIGEGGSLLPRIAKGAGNEAGVEFLQSGGEQLAQNIATQANANPEQSLADGVLESMLQGLFVGGLTGGAFAGAAGRARQAEQAGQGAELLGHLNEMAAASKVLQRDPETFEQFVTQAAENGPVQQVFIDANTLMQSGVAEQVAAVSPAVAAQLAEAVQTGGQIAIPVAEYTARIAPTEYAQGLLDHLKTDPEGFSRAEAQQYLQSHAEELRTEVERTLAEQQGDDAFKQSAQAVRANIKAQLDAAARFVPQVNDAYASMVGNFFAVQAAKLGITPEDLFQRYPLKIAAERLDGPRFEQAPPIVQLDGAEVAAPDAAIQDIRAAAKDYYAQHLAGKVVRHPGLGEIAFTKRGLKKALSSSANPLKLRLFAALPDLLASGELVRTQENRHAETHPNIKRYHWLRGSVLVDGKPVTVEVNVEEHADGKLYYNHALPGNEYFQEGGVQARGPSIPGETPAAEHQGATGEHQTEAIGPEPSGINVAGSADGLNLRILEQTARGAFDPATLSISLLKNADLSTFLHESGHFFLEVQADLAASADAPDSIKQDMQAVLAWFGVPSLDAWHNLDFEEKRAYHEQFARGFEAYLFEGKAPSIEMQGLFQRFRAWLLNVYRDLKNLNVELTDEVRGVFDRMLACNEEIALAESGRSMMPLFATAEQAGMTSEEFAAYQALGVDATNEAIQDLQARGLRDMQWLHNARGRIIKQLQAEAKTRRADVRRQVAEEVNGRPIYRADRFLRYGELELPADAPQNVRRGAEQANLDGAKLALPALKEMYGEDENAIWRYLPTGKNGLAASEGMHPDLVADLFGFTSGDELVRELLAAPKRGEEIEALTDVRMLEQYGDLTSAEAIEKAADRAIHNDARARFVATEANALAKATGQRKVLTSAAKEYARALIARLKVRDIRPGQYASAEARAAKAAEKASKAGDLATAAAEKRNQLIQGYATRAAYDAQDAVDKGLRYLKKFEGDIKGLDADYADQVAAVLDRFDLRKGQSLKAIDKRTSLAAWAESQREQGMEPEIPADLLNEAFRTSYKNLTVEEFQGLVDTVRQIEHLGRLKHKLLTAADQRAYEAVRDEIAGSIHTHAQGREADTRTPTTNMGRAARWLKSIGAAHIKAATWARVLDGGKDGGPMWEYFVRSANARGDQETTMRAEATAKLSAILAPVFKLGRMGGAGQFFPSIGRSLNREARIAIALNMGNEGNRQRLLGGEGWTLQQVAPVLQALTAQEWHAVQAVWDHFESYRSQIAEKERRVYGKEPEWVEPHPFAVTTANGQTVQLRGGYYPIKYDPAASQRAEEHTDAEGAKRQLQGAYTTATTRRSFTKARVDEVAGRPLLYTLSGLYSGVNDVIHDLAWHEWLIDANRLLRSHTIDRAIREHYGPEVKQQLKTWVADIAEGDKGIADAGFNALARLRQGVSASGLGFNVMSALMQPLGITQSITRVGAQWVGRGIAKYIAHPIDLTRQVNEMSDFMANRARTRFRELNELRNQVQNIGGGIGKVDDFIGRNAYFLMMRCQQMVDVPTWWGAYEKAISDGNEEHRAIALADQAVIDAQGGGQVKDQSAMERSSYMKLFTVFYSFMNTALNIGVAQTMSANTPAKRAKLAVDYAMLYVVPVVLGYALNAVLTPGDSGDDDDLEKLAGKLVAAQLDYLMGLMVLVREFADAGKAALTGNYMGYQGPAGLRVIPDAGKFLHQAHQGEFDDAFRKAAVNMVGDLSGLPSAQVNRTVTGIQAIKEGKTSNLAAVVFGFQEKR